MNDYVKEDKAKAIRNLANTVDTYKKLLEDFDDLNFDSVLIALDNLEDCCKEAKKEVDACVHRVLVTMNVDIVVDVLAAVDEDEDLILEAADAMAYHKLASGDYQNEATEDRDILTQLSGDGHNDTTV
jgi:hypothetical protein